VNPEDELRNEHQAFDDVREPLIVRCIVQHIGRVQCITNEFDVRGRVVPVALDFLQLEPRRLDGVVHDIKVGVLLGILRFRIQLIQARFDVAQQLELRRNPRGTEILKHIIEHGAPVFVITDAGGRSRRQRQRAEYKIIHDLVKLPIGGRRVRALQSADQNGCAQSAPDSPYSFHPAPSINPWHSSCAPSTC